MDIFDWDRGNIGHIAQHDISPEEAEQVVLSHPFDLGSRVIRGELRIAQTGETESGRVLVVVTTLRGDLTRVVTAYPAKASLRALYAAQKGLGDVGRIGEGKVRD